jgi:Helicase associated domain
MISAFDACSPSLAFLSSRQSHKIYQLNIKRYETHTSILVEQSKQNTMTLETKHQHSADTFCMAFGTRKLNFLDDARRNSLFPVAQTIESSCADDLLSPIEIEWDLPSHIVGSSHPTYANITDIESSGSSICSVSTDIFEDATPQTLPGLFLFDMERSISSPSSLSTQDHRFKPFHEEKWSVRYKELQMFHQEHGHAAVPHTYPRNQQLARWIKR